MKKFLLSSCVVLLSCIAFAQNMVVVLKDGTEVKYSVIDIDSIRIDDKVAETTPVPAEETGLLFNYDDATMTASVTYYGTMQNKEDNYDLSEAKIPSQVLYEGNVYEVTSIGSEAFAYCENLKSIEIPESVTSIGVSAFAFCKNLTSIKIPESVTSIESSAFSYCKNLKSIKIPESVTSIESYAFENCISLTSIVVDKDNKVYDSRENCNAIIETASNTLLFGFPNTVIPNSVTSIESYAFYGCRGMTSIEIPNSVTSIERYAFYGCIGMTSIEIPESVTSIKDSVFSNCTNLKTARVPASLNGKIKSNVFPSTCEIEWY